MSLFDENIKTLNKYRNNVRIKESTKGFVILSRKEFTNWYSPVKRTRSQSTEAITEANILLLSELFTDVCRSGIGKYYLKSSVGHVVPYRRFGEILPSNKFDVQTREIREEYFDAKKDHLFDLLVCVKENVYKNKNATQDQKSTAVVSFLISELGECRKKPNTFSVNLICSRRNSFKANFLLAAMMYCVKSSKYDKEVVLELAGKYQNIGGFKSYARVGFNRDASLYGHRCFGDIDNLPMSVDVSNLDEEDIIDYVISGRPAREVTDELDKHFLTLPRDLSTELSEKIATIADYYHDLDVDEEPKSEDYNKIVKGIKDKEGKKRRLFETIKALTPQNTPVRMSRQQTQQEEERSQSTVKEVKKILKAQTKKSSSSAPRKRKRQTSRASPSTPRMSERQTSRASPSTPRKRKRQTSRASPSTPRERKRQTPRASASSSNR